jgi:hypothetical protein
VPPIESGRNEVKFSVFVAGNVVEIQTEYLPNASYFAPLH